MRSSWMLGQATEHAIHTGRGREETPPDLSCRMAHGMHTACRVPSLAPPALLQVEYPDKRTTLCLLPAKFHKKLWIKKGNYLYVESLEDAEDTDSRVTGQIVRVLFGDDVKQLKKMEGVWYAAAAARQPASATRRPH